MVIDACFTSVCRRLQEMEELYAAKCREGEVGTTISVSTLYKFRFVVKLDFLNALTFLRE